MSRIIYVVHSKDALPWATFIKNLFLKQRSTKYEVRSVLATDLVKSSPSSARLDMEGAEVVVAVLSPEHLQYLGDQVDFTYSGLVRGGQKGVLFFCGTSVSELEGTERVGKDLRTKFPYYKDWSAVQHEDANNLAKQDWLDRIQPLRSLVYQLIPDRVRCENGATVTVSFNEVIAAKPTDIKMALYISKDDGGPEEKVDVTWMNDKTVFFKVPERKEGRTKVRVVVNGNEIPGTSDLYYESSCELMSEMMQLYIHAMDRVFALLLSKSLISNSELDAFLFNIFCEDEPKGIQPMAFEELFGIYRYNPGIKSEVELPTLLHFASKFGLEKFHSWLENLPDAKLASNVRNCEGLQAEKVNRFRTKASTSPASSQPPVKLPAADDHLFEDTEEYYLDMETTTRIRNENKLKAAQDFPIMGSDPIERDSDEDACIYTGDDQTYGEIFEDTYTTIPAFCNSRPKSIAEEEEEEEKETILPQMPSYQDNRPAAQSRSTMDPGQQKLIEIMTQVKCGELSMEEANILFEEWKIQHSQKPSQQSNFPQRSKQPPKEMHPPLKPPVIPKDAKSGPALPESLPSRLGRNRGSDASDKTSSTASNSSFDSLYSSAHGSTFSHSSGIDIDLIDEEVRSQRNSGGSIDGNNVPPPIPARDVKPVPNKGTTLPRGMPGLNKFEGATGKGDKR